MPVSGSWNAGIRKGQILPPLVCVCVCVCVEATLTTIEGVSNMCNLANLLEFTKAFLSEVTGSLR